MFARWPRALSAAYTDLQVSPLSKAMKEPVDFEILSLIGYISNN
jgi:hypothetical protein